VSGSSDVLHSHFPFFVISREPLGRSADGDAVPFAVVNLAALDEPGLTQLVDDLVEEARRGGDLMDCVPEMAVDLSNEYDDRYGGWGFAFAEALELKPNVFGVGLNGNAIVEWLRARKARRTRAREIAQSPGDRSDS
jgi:hypothetical protein